jgi:PAS domain S-box-containing protein
MNFIEGVEPLQAVLNSLTDGVVVADTNGEFLFFNPAAERILGIGSRDIAQENWTMVYGCYRTDKITLYPPEQLPLARAIRGEEVLDEVVFIKNPKRTEGVWISISASPIRDEKDKVYCGIIVFRDITKKRNRQEILERFASGVEQTADSVVITDLQGVIEYVNPAFEAISGYKQDEAIGKTPRIINSGKHDRVFHKNLWETITNGKSYRGTIINKKKNGELYWSDQSITPLKDNNGNITSFVSVLKDITEQRRLQEQELQLNTAREIQQFYYNPTISLPGFDIAGHSYPADMTGGDYFDFIPMPNDCISIVVGDVTGHGIGAALIMAEVRAYLRAFTKQDNDPATILTKLNSELFADLQAEQFVTLILAQLNCKDSSIIYASAGHVPAFLINNSGNVDCIMESTGLPLGFMKDYKIENSKSIKLTEGNIAVFFTDGIQEALSPKGKEYGFDRALDVVNCQKEKPSDKIIESLYQEIRYYCSAMSSRGKIQSENIREARRSAFLNVYS